jgi:threonyl-tRNA synthetase
MAHAIQQLYPNEQVQLGIGPTIDHGFYYDIDMETKLTEADLKKIEKRMKEMIKKKLPISRHEIERDRAVDFFKQQNQLLKLELIKDFPSSEVISYYQMGEELFDLCRGPHVENTSELPMSFKLTNTAGAYWRGDETRPMLQRVYAASFLTKEELSEHLTFLQEAKKRDHRKLGKELDLFHFNQEAPGSPFFRPKGTIIYNELVEFMRHLYRHFGYSEVITPQILDVDLWHTSGHYENYKENMYFTNIDDREYALKPMNCPSHMLMFKNTKYSYRDLPLRFADFGRLHRYEKSGVLAGLTRVRTFCQDDAHVFLPKDKILGEIQQLLKMFFICYEHFGFDHIKICLSTRPDKKIGDDQTWDESEAALKSALEQSGHKFEIKEGDGAFYGPKIDVQIADAIKRYHQLGTIQLDFMLPERFDLKFTNSEGQAERPVVIHRALLGSLERFIGVYTEHVGGAFPFWLAPVQIKILPVNNQNHLEYCQKIQSAFLNAGLRVELDARNESLGKKTRETQKAKVPFTVVIGDKEAESESVNLRAYGQQETKLMTLSEATDYFTQMQQSKYPKLQS